MLRRPPIALLATASIQILSNQVSAGEIRWSADSSECLAVGPHFQGEYAYARAILLRPCDVEEESVQFTTTGTGPIHWATHPGKCLRVEAVDGGSLMLMDCVDVVNQPAAQFVALAVPRGRICLAGYPGTCLRIVEHSRIVAGQCPIGTPECEFSSAAAIATYARSEHMVDGAFFDRFTFYSAPDPTHGQVRYVDKAVASAEGMVRDVVGNVYIGADVTSRTQGAGRKSVRIESKATWREGLFIVSLKHIPTGCGTWPAMWLLGENAEHPWPAWGEYDIIEGVHMTDRVSTTLHTGVGCNQEDAASKADFSGRWQMGIDRQSTNCDVGATGQYGNQGCSQLGPKGSMGAGFNANGGGTYAAEWDPTAGYIRTWFWPAGQEPEDIIRGAPDPGHWPQPYSFFRLGDMCPASHFQDMRLIFDLTFCGDLGDPTFASSCPEQAARNMTCEQLVSEHPELLKDAFWSIQSLDVFNINRPPPPPRPTEPPLPPPPQVPMPAPPQQPLPQPVAPTVPVNVGVEAPSPSEPEPTGERSGAEAGKKNKSPDLSAVFWVFFSCCLFLALPVILMLVAGFVTFPEVDDGDEEHARGGPLPMSVIFMSSAKRARAAIAAGCERLKEFMADLGGQLSQAAQDANTSLADLWAHWSLHGFGRRCGSAFETCRLGCDSMWEAVAGSEWPEPLRIGDKVVVVDQFKSASGHTLEKGMEGRVKRVTSDGVAHVEFWQTWHHVSVQVPPEQHAFLQVRRPSEVGSPRALSADGHRTGHSTDENGGFVGSETWERQKAKIFAWANANRSLLALCALGIALAIVVIVRSMTLRAGQCSQEYRDCRQTLCCQDPSHTCYEKVDAWAACLPSCEPGIHYDEKPQWRSPWTCRVLSSGRRLSGSNATESSLASQPAATVGYARAAEASSVADGIAERFGATAEAGLGLADAAPAGRVF